MRFRRWMELKVLFSMMIEKDLSFSTSQMLVAILQLARRTGYHFVVVLLSSQVHAIIYLSKILFCFVPIQIWVYRPACSDFRSRLIDNIANTLMPSINMRYITLEPYGFLPSNKNGFSYEISTEICNWCFLGVHTIIIMIVWVVSRQNNDDWLITFDHHNIWWLMFSIVICFR